MSESPRLIYIDACSKIAAHFADRGFRFAKSGPHISRKCGEFTFRISFQSSRDNLAGSTVKLWIHGTVFSKKLQRWRMSYPGLQAMDYVAGGQIGNLSEEATWYDWDLAQAKRRQSTITEAIPKLERIALPYFAQFEALDSFTVKLQQMDIPSMSIDRVAEFLMCFADRAAARNAAVNFLVRNPQLVSNYKRDFGRYAERGLQYKGPSGSAGKLAYLSHLFGFGDITEPCITD